jgi:putative ATP-binding cassette transporter
MHLLYFLLRSSGGMLAIAVVTGFLSGGSSAALIALVSHAVSHPANSSALLLWGFVGLALVAAITSLVSQVVLIRLSQNAIFELRMHLSRQILGSELGHLEQLGAPQLLATLTDDVQAITEAVQMIPFLCVDLAIVTGCLIYLLCL